jgi:DNA-binding NarL/FixJ family response regulator
MIRVIAIDDHPLVLKMITEEINGAGDMQIVGTANHGSRMLSLVRELSPDVVILDLGMSSGVFEPISAVQQLLQEHPNVKVLILTGNDSPAYIRDLIKVGAMGYMLKFEDLSLELPKAVRTIYNGQRFYSPATTNILFAQNELQTPELTNRELQILRLVAEGHQNERIGEIVGVSGKWVRNVLTGVYNKLDVQGEVNQRVAAVNKARELGLLPEK